VTIEAPGAGRPPLPERSGSVRGEPMSEGLLGLLLAGGRSERMGRSKALLEWGDERMVDAGRRALAETCMEVLVAVGEAGDLGLSHDHLIEDALPGAGPLGAIVAGLTEAERRGMRGVLVLACDMPLVTRAELDPLIDSVRAGADAALWRRTAPVRRIRVDARAVCSSRSRGRFATSRRALRRCRDRWPPLESGDI
jgi:molybdopterin-guanine dinucleotide biosynthesis protein A